MDKNNNINKMFNTLFNSYKDKYNKQLNKIYKHLNNNIKYNKNNNKNNNINNNLNNNIQDYLINNFDLYNLNNNILDQELVTAVIYGYTQDYNYITSVRYKIIKNNKYQEILTKLKAYPWAEDNINLSQRLYNLSQRQINIISSTIAGQFRAGLNLRQLSQQLYDGYGYSRLLPETYLPNYLQRLVNLSSHSNLPYADRRVRAEYTRCLNQVNKLSQNGAPTHNLKAAYKQLLDASMSLSSDNLAKSIYTAVNEKSRYLADRIARTEIVRAYTDAFLQKTINDHDVIGYKLTHSSRHSPYSCICDEYKILNHGVFTKKHIPPIPIHPHCMCTLTEIYNSDPEAKYINNNFNYNNNILNTEDAHERLRELY